MTGEQLLIKTIKQCNAFEARVIELESDEYVNNLKADAIELAANEANEVGYIRPFHFLLSVANKIRENK